MEPLHIIIDTREQCPWAFPPHAATVTVRKLDAGDYALAGDEESFAIERKSLDDFVGTVSGGWERFERELARMEDHAAKMMIVEGDLRQCCFYEAGEALIRPEHRHPQITPQFILKRVAELSIRHGMTVLFADCADIAAGLAWAAFKQRQEQTGETE